LQQFLGRGYALVERFFPRKVGVKSLNLGRSLQQRVLLPIYTAFPLRSKISETFGAKVAKLVIGWLGSL